MSITNKQALYYEWAVSPATISKMIAQTCDAIHRALKDSFLTTRTSPDEWIRISNAMEYAWNFPML